MILGALLVYMLQKAYFLRKWRDGLEADVCFQKTAAVENRKAVLTETITNRKRLPLISLQVKFSVAKELSFVQNENTKKTDRNYRNDIFSVSGYEQITRTLPFVCKRRGYFQISQMDLIANDLFFSKKQISVVPQNTHLYVYPAPADAFLFEAPFRYMLGTFLTRACQYEDPFEFRGIRPYEPHDSMRDVNWKATARTGGLKVNQHNFTTSQKVVVLLNLSSDSNWKYEKLYEESVRVAAAFANACAEKGIPVSILTNGCDIITQKQFTINAGSGRSHAESIMRGLARIDSSQEAGSMIPLIERQITSPEAYTSLYILISKVQNEKLLQTYSDLCAVSKGSMWIAPLHPDMDHCKEKCPNAVSMKWEVPYAG